MVEHKEIVEAPRNKDEMMQRLSADTSRAFLEDIKVDLTQTKIQAQAEWWQALNKDFPAPTFLNEKNLDDLQKQGWQFKPDQYYNKLFRQLKDGSHEENTYDNRTGERVNTVISRYADKDAREAGKASQFIDIYYRDGKQIGGVTVRSGFYESEFRATFDKDGKLENAYEFGRNKDSVNYTFRDNGTLYEALKRSKSTSEVVNDQIFDKSGQPVSDYNPLYLYEKIKRPIENLYLGLREIHRSGGMF